MRRVLPDAFDPETKADGRRRTLGAGDGDRPGAIQVR